MSTRPATLVFLFLSLLITIPSWLLAQSAISTGAISGRVTDPSGAAIPAVRVAATDFVLLTPNVNADGDFGTVSRVAATRDTPTDRTILRWTVPASPAPIWARLAAAPASLASLASSPSRNFRCRTTRTRRPTAAAVPDSSTRSPSPAPTTFTATPSTTTPTAPP